MKISDTAATMIATMTPMVLARAAAVSESAQPSSMKTIQAAAVVATAVVVIAPLTTTRPMVETDWGGDGGEGMGAQEDDGKRARPTAISMASF